MGLGQNHPVSTIKRQYCNENSNNGDSSSNVNMRNVSFENKEIDDESLKVQFNKRSRDTSPPQLRKPLTNYDMSSEVRNSYRNDESPDCKNNEIETNIISSDKSNLEMKGKELNFCGGGGGDNNLSLDSFKLPSIPSSAIDQNGSVPPPSHRKYKIGKNGHFVVLRGVARRKSYEALTKKYSNSGGGRGKKGGFVVEVESSSDSYEEYDAESSSIELSGDDESNSSSSHPTIISSSSDESHSITLSKDSSTSNTTSNASHSSYANINNISGESKIDKIVRPIRPSLFPYVPPFINFCSHDESGEKFPDSVKQGLKWRLSPITPIVVKKTVSNTGFRLLRKTVDWNGQWGKHLKAIMFRTTLKDFQKLNHLPATFQIGRKDKLWKNYNRMLQKYGKEHFNFLPTSYVLPHDIKLLKQAWESSNKGRPWIIKPPAGARGNGIHVINQWSQVPKKTPTIVQKYITKPYLINGRKFDIRLYVLVTGINPLKIYLYQDGLVRFAPLKYSLDSKRVSDRNMHLTNYSINKNCDLYTQNTDADSLTGHKWTLKSLWRYFSEHGIKVPHLWSKIEDIAIKTLLSAEHSIESSSFNMPSRYNGYELFGLDIILDEKLRPWLLEVNISPSLHSSSPLDLAVKGPLIRELFNIVGFHFPPHLSSQAKKSLVKLVEPCQLETPVFDKRLYVNALSPEEKTKQNKFRLLSETRDQYLSSILEDLTPDDIRHLIKSEDELSQCSNGGFHRIFPTTSTHYYFDFFDSPRYYNLLLDAWEESYSKERGSGIKILTQLCENKLHLNCVQNSTKTSFSGSDNETEDQIQIIEPEPSLVSSISPQDSFSHTVYEESCSIITYLNNEKDLDNANSNLFGNDVENNVIDINEESETDLLPSTSFKNSNLTEVAFINESEFLPINSDSSTQLNNESITSY